MERLLLPTQVLGQPTCQDEVANDGDDEARQRGLGGSLQRAIVRGNHLRGRGQVSSDMSSCCMVVRRTGHEQLSHARSLPFRWLAAMHANTSACLGALRERQLTTLALSAASIRHTEVMAMKICLVRYRPCTRPHSATESLQQAADCRGSQRSAACMLC